MGEDKFKNMLMYAADTAATNSVLDYTTTTGTSFMYYPGTTFGFDIKPNFAEDIRAMVLGDFPARDKASGLPTITEYDIYNGRVLIVRFADGTSAKCVADKDTDFDFYTGLAFCLFKKVLGKDGHKRFNVMMRNAMRQCDKIDERHEKEKAEAAKRKAKRRKEELKRAAKAAKARQEQIDIYGAAMLDALRKHDAENDVP